MPGTKPHNERLFYRILYTARIFEFTSKLYKYLGRRGFGVITAVVSWTYAVTHHGVRETVRRNMRLLTNREMSARDAIRVFTNFGATIGDYVAVGVMPPDEAAALGQLGSGTEFFNESRTSGRGVILATGHFGFFEYGALLLGRMGYPVTVVTFSEPTVELTRWRAEYRKRWGAETIELGPDPFSSLQVVQAIESGRFTAMLVDRPMGEKSLPVPLPGGTIPFSISPALLGWVTGCAIVPVAVRRADKSTYEVIAKPCLHVDRTLPRKEAIEACTRALAASLFEEICEAPDQWYQFLPVPECEP